MLHERLLPLGIFFQTNTPAIIVSSKNTSAAVSELPPADQAFATGSYETKIAVSPPIAVEAITPALNNPAYPHCMLSPIDMTAEIRQRLKIASATFHDCPKPTIISSKAIMEKQMIARFVLVIAPSRVKFRLA